MAVRVDASRPSFSQAWEARRNAPGGPILAFGALWVIDTGDGREHMTDADIDRLFELKKQ